MIERIIFCCALLLMLPALAEEQRVDVAVKRVDVEGEQVFDVTASGTVKASPAVVWKILTDYERMPEFVPDLERTKILSRAGNKATVEQFGRARFLFFSREIHLVVQVVEEPASAIDISLVTGDMKVYRCRWEITPVPETGGTRINYNGKMVPKFYVPGMLGSNIVRRDIERMMGAVLERLDRPEE
jgi:ribosome-associated toxin RatA of RatAB toxin-antitoxin module